MFKVIVNLLVPQNQDTIKDMLVHVMDSLRLRGQNLLEGGRLNGEEWCLSKSNNIWAYLRTDAGQATIEFCSSVRQGDTHIVPRTKALLRAVRNLVEDAERGELMLRGIHFINMPQYPAILDEWAKMMTPTEGFSERQYIINNKDEPFFVLLGRDPQAPGLVNAWADLRECCPTDDKVKIDEARQIANAMEEYKKNVPKPGMSIEEYEIGCHHKNIQENDE